MYFLGIQNLELAVLAAMKIIGSSGRHLYFGSFSLIQKICELENQLVILRARTLPQRLIDLESQGIITRENLCRYLPQIEYSLTNKGRIYYLLSAPNGNMGS